MNVEEPLPCPFCGNEVKSQSFWWHGCAPGNGPRGYYVFCLECSETDALDGPRRDTLEDAIAAWNRRTPPAMSADHIPDASPAVTDVGKLIQAPLVGRLVEVLTELLSALSPLSVMGKPIAALDTRLSRAISDAVMLVGSEANPAPIKTSVDTGELRERVALEIRDWPFPINQHEGCLELADAILDLIQSERVH